MNDSSAVIQTLTEGLRELPTDDAARVKHFLLEYLGNAQRPVPFGGRGHDFDHLDAWLAGPESPAYTLLAAPAGRGKSALLLRWCQHLLTRSDLAVVYFPVSIRFRTNLAGVVFPALVALLAHLHGEKIPANPNVQEEVWRGLLTEYMTRSLPDGRLLVLVLDGVDEAADWTADPTLFPPHPPTSLRVVLSARYLANDRDASAWLERLGWTRPGLARAIELYPLDRTGITSVLVQMGFPLNLLGTRVDIIAELHRLSEGDPLLIRLYVDDLWEQGETRVRQLQPEDLHTLRPGLVGYFERWWHEQRLLWQNISSSRSETTVESVLNLLAGAFGPLSQQDILSLAGKESGLNEENFAKHLAPLDRFVIGDGMRQGYVFSHPRLANYFLEERLSPSERQEVEQRFLAWGQATLAKLNTGELLPEHASAYIVQYYGTHLERAQAEAPALLALLSDGWRRAWEKLDRAQAGFLGDSERAWRAAERANAAATSQGLPAPYLGAEIRSLLCRVSINSMTNNIAPRLMLEAVKTGIWTPAQGLASIRLTADLAPRARELVGLAPSVQEPLRTDILQEALDTLTSIKDERARLDALVELAPGFAPGQLEQILEIVGKIEDEADRAGILAELALACAAEQSLLEKALWITENIEEEEYRALALVGLATVLTEEQIAPALRLAREIQDERYRVQALVPLIPRLSALQHQEMLQDARLMWERLSQIRLLTTLTGHVTGALQTEILQETLHLIGEIVDQEYRVELLVWLIPVLPIEQLRVTLQEIQHLRDENYRAQTLGTLLPYLADEQLPEFLQAVQTLKSEEQRTPVLCQLFPRLPEAFLEQVLALVQHTWDEGLRVEMLAQLVPVCSPAVLPRLLDLVQAIKDPGYRIWLQAELATTLHGTTSPLPFDIQKSFATLPRREERLQLFLAILPRLSNEALLRSFNVLETDIFGFYGSIRSEDQQAHILTKLCSRLPEKWVRQVLALVRKMSQETYQVQVLLTLAPRIQADLLPIALDIVRNLKEPEKRSQVLEVLVSSLPEERKGERVREMLQVLQVIKDENWRARLIIEFIQAQSETVSEAAIKLILAGVEAMRMEIRKAQILIALATHVPAQSQKEILKALARFQNEEERARVLQAVAPYINEDHWPAFLEAIQQIQDERWRAQVLATLFARISKKTFGAVLGLIENIQNKQEQMELLGTLTQHAPEGSLSQLWSTVQGITDSTRRVWVLGALALRLPEEFFAPLREAIEAIQDEGRQMAVLGALAPHMSQDFFHHLWTMIQEQTDVLWQRHALAMLAPSIPDQAVPMVFQAVRDLSRQTMGTGTWENTERNILEVLATKVPANFFHQFWQSIDSKQDPWWQTHVRTLLVTQMPAEAFPQVWQTVLTTENLWNQARLLIALVPHVPEHSFGQIWELARKLYPQTKLLDILKSLIPCCPEELRPEMLEMIDALYSPAHRYLLLESFLPYLSETQCDELLKSLLPDEQEESVWVLQITEPRSNGLRSHLLLQLIPYISEKSFSMILPVLLLLFQEIKVDESRIELLLKVAPRVTGKALPHIVEAIWTIKTPHDQMLAWSALLAARSYSDWTEVLALVNARTQATGQAYFLSRVLATAGKVAQPPAPDLLYPALNTLLRLLAQQTRQQTLEDLINLVPVIQASGDATALPEACSALLEVGLWWP